MCFLTFVRSILKRNVLWDTDAVAPLGHWWNVSSLHTPIYIGLWLVVNRRMACYDRLIHRTRGEKTHILYLTAVKTKKQKNNGCKDPWWPELWNRSPSPRSITHSPRGTETQIIQREYFSFLRDWGWWRSSTNKCPISFGFSALKQRHTVVGIIAFSP